MMRDTKCKPEPSTIADDLPVDAYKGMPMGKGLAWLLPWCMNVNAEHILHQVPTHYSSIIHLLIWLRSFAHYSNSPKLVA